MDAFILTILTPEGQSFEGKTTSLIAPGSSGYFEVLTDHAHFVSTLQPGAVTVKSEGKTLYFAIDRGAAEAINNDVRLLVEHCEVAQSEEEAKEKAKVLAEALQS